MARPRSDNPTPAELEILKVLWDHGPGTVRQAMAHLPGDRAYTTVMTLMNVLHDKGFLRREPRGKAFVYHPAMAREKTLRRMVGDIVDRAFEGSASALVAHLLDQAKPDAAEMQAIRKLIWEHKGKGTRG
jgi:predicted transcriptional regulator